MVLIQILLGHWAGLTEAIDAIKNARQIMTKEKQRN